MLMDTPITRITIAEMSPDQAQQWLEGIRERRMTVHRLLERTKVVQADVRADKLRTRIDKHLPLAIKELERVDKALEKAEQRMVSILGLRLEIQQLTGVDICEKIGEPTVATVSNTTEH